MAEQKTAAELNREKMLAMQEGRFADAFKISGEIDKLVYDKDAKYCPYSNSVS